MSITRLAIDKNRVTFIALLMVLFGGLLSFNQLSRREDPGFIIRVAMITTRLPGASPERVEELITDPIEAVVQQIPELDFVSSTSMTGVSFVYVNIKERYRKMRPIWDNLRRKVEEVKDDLPTGIIGPEVNDEFGDVFGIQLAITGEGYSYRELKDVVDYVRDEFLRFPDVAKVEIYGVQEENIFIEYDNSKLAQLGFSPIQLQQLLASQNIISPGGKINTGQERIILEPTGNFETVEDLELTVVPLPGSNEVIYLKDVASIRRGYVDPPESRIRFNGAPCLGIGISMREGGNIIELGEQVREKVRELEMEFPIGIEFDFSYFQPDDVDRSVNDFVGNLLQAIGLVVIVMLISLGFRTGLVVATLIPMAILLTLIVMDSFSITLNTISLAALIIALGMLVDNSIVMSESIMVRMQRGEEAVHAAVESARELRVPLLTSSLTTAAAFLPIFLAESATGEYTADLFRVVTIALLSSWILALTMIPLLATRFIKIKKEVKSKEDLYKNRFYTIYRSSLIKALQNRWISIAVIVAVFFGAIQLAKLVPGMFFPASDRAFLRAKLEFPVGTPFEVTELMIDDVEKYIQDSLVVNENREEGIVNWETFIGVGTPRYTLAADVEGRMEQFSKMIINTTTREAANEVAVKLEKYLWDRYPDMDVKVIPLDYGPPVSAPIEFRIYGEDREILYGLRDKVKEKMLDTPGTRNVTDNWGPKVKKILVKVDQPRARRAGVSSMDIAQSLKTMLSGFEVTEFREETDIIPVMMRATEDDRYDISKLETMDVFVQASGRSVPLKQVADLEVVWQPSKIIRRDRLLAMTISSYTMTGVSEMDLVNNFLAPWIEEESKNWPMGYYYELGGANEASEESQQSINDKLPIGFGIILLLLVAQFNSFRKPLIILLTIPLALIGVFVGLVVLKGVFGFMTFLGVISLAGIVINNAIVLIDRIQIEIDENGLPPNRAVIEAAQQRLRPIILTTTTTICGLIPLYLFGGPLWESMAIAIMFGLLFATMLTLGVVPILYSMLFKVGFKGFKF